MILATVEISGFGQVRHQISVPIVLQGFPVLELIHYNHLHRWSVL